MSIELTPEQSDEIAMTSLPVEVIDPRTRQTYRLIDESDYARIKTILNDDSPWSAKEMAILAGRAFGKLDDEDYSHYLQDKS